MYVNQSVLCDIAYLKVIHSPAIYVALRQDHFPRAGHIFFKKVFWNIFYVHYKFFLLIFLAFFLPHRGGGRYF
jgi:hypothetical protein